MTKAPVGVLLLHGLTSHLDCIDPVAPLLEKHNIPYRIPVLRGHMTKPSDLAGVKWQDWVEDGQTALDNLLLECDKVLPVALSMGCLVALNLALDNPAKIQGLVTIAPALKLKSKMSPLVPVIARFQKDLRFKPDPKGYFDPEQARTSRNYPGLPSSALVEFVRMGARLRNWTLLSKITVPALVLATVHDRTIDPRSALFLYQALGSRDKRLVWFDRSGHEMLRDAQRQEVLDTIEEFVVAHAGVTATSQ
jgi:carboxylesterase